MKAIQPASGMEENAPAPTPVAAYVVASIALSFLSVAYGVAASSPALESSATRRCIDLSMKAVSGGAISGPTAEARFGRRERLVA